MPDRYAFLARPDVPKEMREILENLRSALNSEVFAKIEGAHLKIVLDAAVTNKRIPHGLKFVPKDVVQTFVTPDSGVTVTWNYDEFDATYIDLTTNGACTIRAIVGRYEEG